MYFNDRNNPHFQEKKKKKTRTRISHQNQKKKQLKDENKHTYLRGTGRWELTFTAGKTNGHHYSVFDTVLYQLQFPITASSNQLCLNKAEQHQKKINKNIKVKNKVDKI